MDLRCRFALALGFMLLGCAQMAPPEPKADRFVDDMTGQGRRQDFVMHARVAIRSGAYRDTLVLDWAHQDQADQLQFSSPLGNAVGQLEAGPEGAVLRWGNDPPRQSARADALLKEALGVPLSLEDLSHWVQGSFPKNADVLIEGDASSKVMRFTVFDWQVRLERWRAVGAEWVPGLMTLNRDSAEVKLLVDRWSLVRHD